MDTLSELSLEFTRWLQSNYPNLEPFFSGISALGGFEFYLFILTIIYWCLEKKLGRAMAYVLIFSYAFNTMAKHFLRDTRPYWLNPDIGLKSEENYGMPSGHAQQVTVFLGMIAMYFRRLWIWIVACILILLMALSRVYLGVHDIDDVIAGIILGALILVGYDIWNRFVARRFANRILGQRLLLAILVPIVLVAVYAAVLFIIGTPRPRGEIADYFSLAERNSLDEMAQSVGFLLGSGVGFVLEVSRVRFKVTGSFWRRFARYFVGIIVAAVIWLGLGELFPEEPVGLALPFIFFRSIIVSFWIAYFAPWTFVRLKLADAHPEPEVTLTL